MSLTAHQHADARRGSRALAPAALAAVLLGPALPGAACRGRAPEFDVDLPGETDEQREQRHAKARAICARCPARRACAAALDNAPGDVTGVWAGRVVGRPGRPPRRVRKPG